MIEIVANVILIKVALMLTKRRGLYDLVVLSRIILILTNDYYTYAARRILAVEVQRVCCKHDCEDESKSHQVKCREDHHHDE